MVLKRFSCLAATMAALSPICADAQTANGSPTDPSPPGLVGTPPPGSRTAPSVGRPNRAGATVPPSKIVPPPKPTAAELAEQRKLEHDLHICIGC